MALSDYAISKLLSKQKLAELELQRQRESGQQNLATATTLANLVPNLIQQAGNTYGQFKTQAMSDALERGLAEVENNPDLITKQEPNLTFAKTLEKIKATQPPELAPDAGGRPIGPLTESEYAAKEAIKPAPSPEAPSEVDKLLNPSPVKYKLSSLDLAKQAIDRVAPTLSEPERNQLQAKVALQVNKLRDAKTEKQQTSALNKLESILKLQEYGLKSQKAASEENKAKAEIGKIGEETLSKASERQKEAVSNRIDPVSLERINKMPSGPDKDAALSAETNRIANEADAPPSLARNLMLQKAHELGDARAKTDLAAWEAKDQSARGWRGLSIQEEGIQAAKEEREFKKTEKERQAGIPSEKAASEASKAELASNILDAIIDNKKNFGTGMYESRIKDYVQMIPGVEFSDRNAWKALLQGQLNDVIKELSGSAVTAPEMARQNIALPNIYDDDKTFLQKAQQVKEKLEKVRQYALKAGTEKGREKMGETSISGSEFMGGR